MKVLGIDFETQSLEATTTPVTEIGARLLTIGEMDKAPHYTEIGHLSQIVYHPDYPPQAENIIKLTGITDEMLKLEGILPRAALERLIPLMEQADYVMAHNTQFDKTVFDSLCARMHITPPVKRWVCTRDDVDWPDTLSCHKLGHLAYELWGARKLADFLGDKATHRALTDVDLMLHLVFSQFTLEQIIKFADEPWAYLAVKIPPPWEDGGKAKDAVSKMGFSWQSNRRWGYNAAVFEKRWVTRVKENKAPAFCATLAYPWEKLECPKINA